MTAVMEREPALRPTIVRRVADSGLETMNRTVDGQRALCVFWSIEHAEREMEANGFPATDGWRAIERDHQELAQVFDLLQLIAGPMLAVLEPCPEDEDMGGIFEPAELVDILERSLEAEKRA